jgi:hypothetical protein
MAQALGGGAAGRAPDATGCSATRVPGNHRGCPSQECAESVIAAALLVKHPAGPRGTCVDAGTPLAAMFRLPRRRRIGQTT